jgi:hypothetical protein
LLNFLHFLRVSIYLLLFYLCLYLIGHPNQIPSLLFQWLKVLECRTYLILIEFRLKLNCFFNRTDATKATWGHRHRHLLLLHLLRQLNRCEPVLGLQSILDVYIEPVTKIFIIKFKFYPFNRQFRLWWKGLFLEVCVKICHMRGILI